MAKTTSYIHTFSMLLLSRAHISQTLLAEKCGCSVQMINYILLGKRVSADIQEKIANYLGFLSWKNLDEEAAAFQNYFVTRYDRRQPKEGA